MKYEKTKEVLNQLVADLSQLVMVVHQTHWYMRGENFLKLHPLMDDWMDDLNDQLDEISERLIALDGSPYSTLKEMAEHTKIPDEPGNWNKSTPERFEVLAKDYRYEPISTSRGSKLVTMKRTSPPRTSSLASRPRPKSGFG